MTSPASGPARDYVILTGGSAMPDGSPLGTVRFKDAAIQQISENDAKQALVGGFTSAVGMPQAASLFTARLGIPVERCKEVVRITPRDIVIFGEYDGRVCEPGMDSFAMDAPINWYSVTVPRDLIWRPSWATIVLSHSEVLSRSGNGYIFVDPETGTAFLDVERCQGHEDVFPICMAFDTDDAAAGQLREFLEAGDWTSFTPPGSRRHDGGYRGYFIEWAH